MSFCPHCPRMEAEGLEHSLKCKCGHTHAEHNFAGGCKFCRSCDRYDQTISFEAVDAKAKVAAAKRHSPKTKVEPVFERVDLDAMLVEAKKQSPSELVAAMARVDALKQKASTLSSTAERSPD